MLFLWLFISAIYIFAFFIFLVKFSDLSSKALTSNSTFLYSFLCFSTFVTISIISSIVYTFLSTNSYVTSLVSFIFTCFSSSFVFKFLFITVTSFFFFPLKKYFTFPKNVFLHSKNVEICFCFSKYSAFCFSTLSFNFSKFSSCFFFSLTIFFNSSIFIFTCSVIKLCKVLYSIMVSLCFNSISPFVDIAILNL